MLRAFPDHIRCGLFTCITSLRVVSSLHSQRLINYSTKQSMPPKRKAQPTSDTDDVQDDSQKITSGVSKKAKRVATSPPSNEFASNGQPNNKVLPTTIVFPKRQADCLRIATWNICGLAASQKKVGFCGLSSITYIRDVTNYHHLGVQELH